MLMENYTGETWIHLNVLPMSTNNKKNDDFIHVWHIKRDNIIFYKHVLPNNLDSFTIW